MISRKDILRAALHDVKKATAGWLFGFILENFVSDKSG